MATSFRVNEVDATITVASGTGSATKMLPQIIGCNVVEVCVKKPSGADPTYDIEITDFSGYGIWGETGMSGNASRYVDFVARGSCTITIANATRDGVYSVRLWTRYTL